MITHGASANGSGPARRGRRDDRRIGRPLQGGREKDDGSREGPVQDPPEVRPAVPDAPEGPAPPVDPRAALSPGSPAPEIHPLRTAVIFPPDVEPRHEGREVVVLVVIGLVLLAKDGRLLRAQKGLDLDLVETREVQNRGPVVLVFRGPYLPARDPPVVGRPAEMVGVSRDRIVMQPEGPPVVGFGVPEPPVDLRRHRFRPDIGVAHPVVSLGDRQDGGGHFRRVVVGYDVLVFQNAEKESPEGAFPEPGGRDDQEPPVGQHHVPARTRPVGDRHRFRAQGKVVDPLAGRHRFVKVVVVFVPVPQNAPRVLRLEPGDPDGPPEPFGIVVVVVVVVVAGGAVLVKALPRDEDVPRGFVDRVAPGGGLGVRVLHVGGVPVAPPRNASVVVFVPVGPGAAPEAVALVPAGDGRVRPKEGLEPEAPVGVQRRSPGIIVRCVPGGKLRPEDLPVGPDTGPGEGNGKIVVVRRIGFDHLFGRGDGGVGGGVQIILLLRLRLRCLILSPSFVIVFR